MSEEFKAELIALAKIRGLDIAEDLAGELAELAFDVVGLVVNKSETKYDDMIWSAVSGKARELMAELVDKIDGSEG